MPLVPHPAPSQLRHAAALGAVLALLCALVTTLPAGSAAAAEGDGPIDVVLGSVTPAVAAPEAGLLVTGTIRNTSGTPLPVDAVRVSTAYRGLDTRAAVTDWASGASAGDEVTPVVLGEDEIAARLAPGAVVTFQVRVEAGAVAPPFDFATLPLSVDAVDGQGASLGVLRSYLPWDGATGSRYQPIELGWLVPLTVPAGSELVSVDPTTRDRAWEAAAGADSFARRTLHLLGDSAVTFLVDPALMSPPAPAPTLAVPDPVGEDLGEETEPDPSATTGPAPPPVTSPPPAGAGAGDTAGSTAAGDGGGEIGVGPTDAGATGTGPVGPQPPVDPPADVVDNGAQAAAAGLRAALATVDPDALWWLPVGDTDVAALLALGREPAEIGERVGSPVPLSPPPAEGDQGDQGEGDQGEGDDDGGETGEDPLPGDEATAGGELAALTGVAPTSTELHASGRRDVAWPALDAVTDEQLSRLGAVWAASSATTGPLAAVVVPGDSISNDTGLTPDGAQLAADGTALLGYDVALSGLLASAGAVEGDGAVVQRLLAETLAIYQQQPAQERNLLIALPRGAGLSAGALAGLYRATDAAPWLRPVPAADLLQTAGAREPSALGGGTAERATDAGPTAYPVTPESPLTEHRVELIERTREELLGVGEVVAGGDVRAGSWSPVLDQQYSVRWRYERGEWQRQIDLAREITDEITDGIHVNPTTINFFADEGRIQVTVVNELPVTVSNLTMRLTPQNPRLRIVEQPEPITIGPSSRANVHFLARSLTAGRVEVATALTTPNGTAVADEELMEVNVRPTGAWIYWVLGGVAGIILVLGLWRALRPRDGREGR